MTGASKGIQGHRGASRGIEGHRGASRGIEGHRGASSPPRRRCEVVDAMSCSLLCLQSVLALAVGCNTFRASRDVANRTEYNTITLSPCRLGSAGSADDRFEHR